MSDFSGQDKKEAARVIAQGFPYARPQELLAHHIERQKGRLAFEAVPPPVTSFLSELKSDLIYFGIARRIVSGDTGLMVECLRSSARAGYLDYVARGEMYPGGSDCLHVFELLKMLAIGDRQAVEALTSRFPAPFNQGHLDTVTLCNAIYLAIDKHPDPASVIAAVGSRKSTKFFTAMYRCVMAILKRDHEAFSQHLIELLKGNRRQDFHSSMEKIICFEAHAMVNLWLSRNGEDLSQLDGFELPWDRGLHLYARDPTKTAPPDFATISPVVGLWINSLPSQIDTDELAIELKENLLHRLIRRVQVARRKNRQIKSGRCF